jgi:hypothetical protein
MLVKVDTSGTFPSREFKELHLYVSCNSLIQITDCKSKAREYFGNRLSSRYVCRETCGPSSNQEDFYGPSERLHILVRAGSDRWKLCHVFRMLCRLYFCLLAKRENLEPSYSREMHIDERINPRHFSNKPGLRCDYPFASYSWCLSASHSTEEKDWSKCNLRNRYIVSYEFGWKDVADSA